MYYCQHKFNLLAEESEGCAKLLIFFINEAGESGLGNDGVSSGDDDVKLDGQVKKEAQDWASSKEAKIYVLELIAAFDLNPNRIIE